MGELAPISPPIQDRAEPPQPELQAPSGTYDFFDSLAPQADFPNQRRGEQFSVERNGTGVDLYRTLDENEETLGIHVTVYQPTGQEFCATLRTMDIAPGDRVVGLTANLNMLGASRGLPEPQPDIGQVLQIAEFVLER